MAKRPKKTFKRIPKLGGKKGFNTYSGKYAVKYPDKYIGDHKAVTYRSSWEKQAFKYLEEASWVKAWGSEITVIPYLCETDNRQHRYFIDLTIVTQKEEIILVEIKPAVQTKPPTTSNKKRLLTEGLTYVKNQSKWKAAKRVCDKKGWQFQIWTEHHLRSLGCRV